MIYQLLPIPYIIDSGLLGVIQAGVLPFESKRVFFVKNILEGSNRGRHANMNNQEFIIALKGSCHVFIADEKEEKTIVLSTATTGLFIDKGTWVALSHFTDDCILLVFNSTEYDQKDYVYNWEEYIQIKKGV